MKMLTILVEILACCFAAMAHDGRNNLAEGKLKGKVKQVRTRMYYVDGSDTSLNVDKISTFDMHENVLCDSSCLDTSWIMRYENKYDQQDRIVEEQWLEGRAKKLYCRTTYTYDAQGRLKETNRYKSTGELMQRTVCIYDINDKITEETYYTGTGRQNGKKFLKYSKSGVRKLELQYDDVNGRNKLHRRLQYDGDGYCVVMEEFGRRRKANTKTEFTNINFDKAGNYLNCTGNVTTPDNNYILICRREIIYYQTN